MTQEQVLAHSSASASAPGNTSCMTHRKLTTSPTTVSSGNDHAGRKTQLSHWSSRLHASLQMTPQDSAFSTVAHDTWQTLPPGLKHTFAQPQFRTFSSKAHPSELCHSNSFRRTQDQEHYLHYHSLLPRKWARRQVDHGRHRTANSKITSARTLSLE